MDADAEFTRMAREVEQHGRSAVTTRQLLRAVNARRRGSNIVAEIRSRLARHQLRTEPDFEDVGADSKIFLLPIGADAPRAPYLEQLARAAERAANSPETITVREMLRWFDAQRRGAVISEMIRATLAGFDLRTEPDFESVHADEPLLLVRTSPEDGAATSQEPTAEPVRVDELPGEPQANAHATFHVGTLAEAKRRIVCVPPQTKLREALTRMITEQVSHLPIMRNERAVVGVLRWKDLAKYMLVNKSASMNDPVEAAASRAVEVKYDRPFLDVIPEIIQHGCVLVRGHRGEISGIITQKDLGRRLLELAGPFVSLGEIERALRALVENANFTPAELKSFAIGHESGRSPRSVSDLTLGEYQRLFEHPESWDRVGLSVDKSEFTGGLDAVRLVRNGIMHFDPEGPSEDDRKRLSGFLALVYELRKFALA